MASTLRPMILFWFGQLLAYMRRSDRALALFREVAAQNPSHQQAWSSIGFLLAEKGELEPALQAFEKALALDPGDAPARNIAFVLQRLGRHEDAIEGFKRTLEADDKVDRAWYGIGLSLCSLGRYEEAIERFTEAARLQPMNPYAGYQLAGTWHKLGQHDKVRAEYERIKGFDPKVAERIRQEFGVMRKQ
ncbi:MAG: tetratricopeptide repeat protein [Betaproteobacteria bacterium]|nr:tetratricopeptide repeat protein [Betaproteobacteria bacterium]